MRLINADELKKLYEPYKGLRLKVPCEVICLNIEDQPTIQPQGIDKDRLLEELMRTDHLNYYDYDIEAYIECIPVYAVTHIINQQPTSDGWIPVSERLPDMENVLGTTEEGEVKMVWYNPNLKKWFGSPVVHIENVIAWQPLPQPYKESE